MATSEDAIVISSESEESYGSTSDADIELPVKRQRLDDSVILLSQSDTGDSDDSDLGSQCSDHESELLVFDPARVKTLESPVKERQPTVHDEQEQQYLHGMSSLPIYCSHFSKFVTTAQCMDILLDPELSTKLVCKRMPFDVDCNCVFVVDMNKLSNPKDIACDDMGVWKWNGSYRRWLSVDEKGVVTVLGKTLAEIPSIPYYHIWKRYYENKSSQDLKKMIVTLEDSQGDTQNLALLQYTFTFEEHSVKIAPHGNSKKSEGYVRTMPSVMDKLKNASTSNTAKRALTFVSNESGGIMKASLAAALPRGRQQVNDIRRGSLKSMCDPIFSLMMMCKEGEGGKSSNAFVRIVTGAPYPMMLLAFDWTLDDIVRFCTPVTGFSIMGIDPTFNLGAFDVTVTTYHHLLLTTQPNAIKHPVCIGPLFIHVKKDFSAYHFFASSLVGKRPALTGLRCYGTDGEVALVNAFTAVFPQAIHLRCFLHFRENIERKLQQLSISASVIKEYRKDIFGNPSQLELGLVDAESESELDAMLNSLENVWNDRESPFHSPPEFHSWFRLYSRDVIAKSMLRPIREKVGLGSPPEPYYTNDIESKNNILKQHVNRKSSHLPEFVDKMKELMSEQRSEIEKAIASCGEYRIVPQYSNLSCDRQKWFKMTEKQRETKISHFMKADVELGDADSEEKCSQPSTLSTPLDCLDLPPHLKKTIWTNANSIFDDCDSIVQAPGDSTAYIVKSLTGQKPHFVQPSKTGGGFLCDGECLGYKSAKICTHTVAAALKAGNVSAFVCWYKKLKCKPNFTVVAESGKPTTSGKKPRKGATKKASKHIHSIIENASELQFKNRTPVNVATSTSTTRVQPTLPSVSVTAASSHLFDTTSFSLPQSTEPTSLSAQLPFASSSSSVGFSQPSTQLSVPDNSTLQVQVSNPTLTSMHAPLYNYGFQNLGQSMHYYPACSPPPLIPSTSTFLPSVGPTSAQTPTPLIQHEPRPSVSSPLWLCFVRGNISRCNGCKGKIGRQGKKPLPPPDDVVLRHRETVIFQNPNTGMFQATREPRNVYYHAWKTCVAAHFCDFNAALHIRIEDEVKKALTTVHLQHLAEEFNVNFISELVLVTTFTFLHYYNNVMSFVLVTTFSVPVPVPALAFSVFQLPLLLYVFTVDELA